MSSQYTLKISPEQAKEMPMVDLAFVVLKAANTPFYYRDLMFDIAKIKGISDEEVKQVIAKLYTEINIDGRFACVGNNLWGLKRWYPVERAEDAMGNTKRPRIINDEDDDMDDDDLFAEEEDDTYLAGDEADFDAVDEDQDEIFAEEDADEEVVEVDLDEADEVDDDLDADEDLDLNVDEDELDLEDEEDDVEDKK